MTSTPEELAAATRELALAALYEITPASTVGPAAGYSAEESGAVSLRYENRLPGYPGWYWTVTVAQVEDAEPTVLEVELMPGESALLAPDWVPWVERMAEYRAHQAALAEAAAERQDEDESAEDSDADADDEDADDDGDHDESDLLHAGDLDGVDIDELDVDALDSDDSEDDDADDDDSDDTDDDDSDEDDDDSDDDDSDDEDDDEDE